MPGKSDLPPSPLWPILHVEVRVLNNKLLKTFLFVTPLIFLQGCSEGVDQHDHPELTTGKELFELHCASCHHNAGNGNFLAGIPANKDTKLSSAQIVDFIRGKHRENSNMPVWKSMPTAEAVKISNYLKSL